MIQITEGWATCLYFLSLCSFFLSLQIRNLRQKFMYLI
jgi:hypothetical protein